MLCTGYSSNNEKYFFNLYFALYKLFNENKVMSAYGKKLYKKVAVNMPSKLLP